MPEEVRAVGLREQDPTRLAHAALDDVRPQRIFFPRLLEPREKVAEAGLELCATIGVRGPAEVRHEREPEPEDLDMACRV